MNSSHFHLKSQSSHTNITMYEAEDVVLLPLSHFILFHEFI